ncbi:sigma-70 family RNA polymerase sigma factor [Chryseobacterium sp. G0240]|uniref:sigma-70 family RNA polymerase sigma factor n=1 Tax=Chryseobacterium sp. G0240 TaxID=2487066 RepID=UPI000F4505B3|nr:sigma-70 family RNA polymerase sigma factor [Chryseobacterium sp. G0240]ROI06736.1 sigma-70 family RNA polymerase sigma factor [Chryseobacterium sp. G0240]
MNNTIENYRHMLFPYAYNILGTVEDAEDVIQDVMVRYTKVSAEDISHPKNYLIKSVINQSIQLKRKQSKTIRTYMWLPEPVATEQHYRHEDVFNFSLLARMERLSPKERAVFILKEGFDHSHEEIGEWLSCTPENSRKILSRAKEKLKKNGYKEIPHQPSVSDPVRKLIDAIQNGDAEEVKQLLAEDIQFYADGGASIQVVAKECLGNNLVSQLLIYIHQTYNSLSKITFTLINHQPAAVYIQDGQIQSCQIFEVYKHQIIRIDSVIDPQKLKNLTQEDLIHQSSSKI